MSFNFELFCLSSEPTLQQLTTTLNNKLNPLLPKLTDEDSRHLLELRQVELEATQRIELSLKPLEELVGQLSYSPYVIASEFSIIVGELQEIFYWLRNEIPKKMTDSELIDRLIVTFNTQAAGSLTGLRRLIEEWAQVSKDDSSQIKEQPDE